MLVLLAAGVRRRLDHYSFSSFVIGCAFDFSIAYLLYRCSAQLNWFCVSTFNCWFPVPYGFAESLVYALVEAFVRSQKGESSGVLGAIRSTLLEILPGQWPWKTSVVWLMLSLISIHFSAPIQRSWTSHSFRLNHQCV